MDEIIKKLLESAGYELLIGFMIKGAEGTVHYAKAKHVVARIKGFRGWRKVVFDKTEPVFASESENTIIMKKTGLWHWYSHPTKTVTFID